jgi:hypothetical protein
VSKRGGRWGRRWQPNQANNGYLETYLKLGWIGVILLAGWASPNDNKSGQSVGWPLDSYSAKSKAPKILSKRLRGVRTRRR